MPQIKRWLNLDDSIKSAVTRAAMLPVAGVASLICSKIVVQTSGAEGFALFSILVTLPLLIPVSDFGISASLTDAVAKHGPRSKEFRSTTRRAIILLSLIGIVAVAGAAVASISGLWATLLNVPRTEETDASCFALVLIMALGIVLGSGQRVLLGMGRQATSTFLLTSGSVISLVLIASLGLLKVSDYRLMAICFCLGPLIAQLMVAVVALRIVLSAGPADQKSGPFAGTRIRIAHVAIPMAIISVALPLAYQSDRVILAHFGGLGEVSNYSVISVLYAPLLSIVNVGGQALWPMFIKASSDPSLVKKTHARVTRQYAMIGVVLAIGLVAVGPLLVSFIGEGRHDVVPVVSSYALFGAMLCMFALNMPNGMLLMDPPGRRIQAIGSIFLLLSKIPLSIALVPSMGVDGVLLATLAAALICLVLPSWLSVRQRLRYSGEEALIEGRHTTAAQRFR